MSSEPSENNPDETKKSPQNFFKRVWGLFGGKKARATEQGEATSPEAPVPDTKDEPASSSRTEPPGPPEERPPEEIEPPAPIAVRAPAEEPRSEADEKSSETPRAESGPAKRLSPAQKKALRKAPARGGLSPAKRAEERRTQSLKRRAVAPAASLPADETEQISMELPPPPYRPASSKGAETERMVRPEPAAASEPEKAEAVAETEGRTAAEEPAEPEAAEALAEVFESREDRAVEETLAEPEPAPDIMARLEELPWHYGSGWVKLSMVDPERIQAMWDLPPGWNAGGEPALRLRRHLAGAAHEQERIVGFIGPAGDWYFSVAPGSLYDIELGAFVDGRFEARHRSAFLRTPVLRPRFTARPVWRVRRFAPAADLKPAQVWADPVWQGEPAVAAAKAQSARLIAAQTGASAATSADAPAWLAVEPPFDGPSPSLPELAAWRERPADKSELLAGEPLGPRGVGAPRLRRRWLGGSEFRLEASSPYGGASFAHQPGSEAAAK